MQYPISSESEWSCRVEGSGSQCNVLIQPNHQISLVSDRERKEQENRRMKQNTEDRQKVSHIRDIKDGRYGKRKARKTEKSAC